jgi:hypothetical protein
VPASGGAPVLADDELEIAGERPPDLGDPPGLGAERARHLTQPAGVVDDAPGRPVGAVLGELDHDFAGCRGDLVGELLRQGRAAAAVKDFGEEFVESGREARELFRRP